VRAMSSSISCGGLLWSIRDTFNSRIIRGPSNLLAFFSIR